MSGTDPDLATRADLADLGADIRNGFDELLPVLRDIAQAAAAHQPHPHSGAVQQVAFPPHAPPARSERLAWAMFAMVSIMSTVTGGAVVAAFLQGQRISDLRTDMQADRATSEAHQAWAREESQIVRSYIWRGTVPTLNQYPKQEPKK